MKKAIFPATLLILFCFLTVTVCQAQTKVFKEVSEEISSQMQIIEQDGALVGYLMFTQLEKASADSFNYRISIMDENLNDIGTVNFREQKLTLKGVSFEGDVLCLAYLKSNVLGMEYKNRREYKDALPGAKNYVFTQFLNMSGKIIATNPVKAGLKFGDPLISMNKMGFNNRFVADGSLKHDIQIRNLSGKGFAVFYGDETRNNLLVFNTSGQLTWQKQVRDNAADFGLLTSGQDVWLLTRTKDYTREAGFAVVGYNTNDSSMMPRYVLTDKHGNPLKVLVFDNDPVTGKPFISGLIIDQKRADAWPMGKNVARGLYYGCFTINFNGHKKSDVREIYSYWADGSQPGITDRGLMQTVNGYPWIDRAFRDYDGNTWFAGSSLSRRIRYGGIISSVLFCWTIVAPIAILSGGTSKYRIEDALLVKQNAKGALTVENAVPGEHSAFAYAGLPIPTYDMRNIHAVTNSDTRTNFLVIDDPKNITIYNVNQQKVAREIPHKDGNILTSVYPAKEGHVMVSEYNKKEKYTRLSIETL